MRYSIRHFIKHEAFGGIVLMAAAVIAMIMANSDLSPMYHRMTQTPGILFFINDGMMAVFFLLVGLEIKRELTVGELSNKSKALQPVFAALGGMIVPAFIFILINCLNPQALNGWAISCATDIAFALGVLALLGSRVPASIKILLTAIAILDDLGAILVIAFFYSGDLHMGYVLLGAAAMCGLTALNRLNMRRLFPYLLVGSILWYAMLKAGLHPTLAGVVTALFIPLLDNDNSPLMRLQHHLHGWVVFLVLPIFALANAGLSFEGISIGDLGRALPLGVMLGLLIGKPVGIMGGLYIGHKMGVAVLPSNRKWKDYLGLACLCGIGFTMSLFIGGLAFEDSALINQAKLGVLSASLLSAGIGWTVCRITFAHKPSQ